MKQLYSLSLIILGSFISLSSLSAQGFVHKDDLKVDRLRSSSAYRRTVKIADLFTYPEGIDVKSNISENSDVSISFNSTNESGLFFDGYYYSSYGGLYFYYNVPAGVYGLDTLTVKIEYTGISDSTLLIAKTNPMRCVDDSYTMDIGDTLAMVVTSNDAPRNYFDYSSLEIIDFPALGVAEITDDGTIEYINNTATPNYSSDKIIYRIADTDANYDTASVAIDIHRNSYASKLFDFLPAPGQFVNTTWANAVAGEKVLGNTSGGVSLGGFGGYVIVGFDQAVVNRSENAYGVDFTIVGNAFGGWGEPAAVQVMKDDNGNGLPDDTWYELAGSEYYFQSSVKDLTMTYYNPKYNGRHTIPYSTDKGFNGAMRTNSFHQQSYYPDPQDFGIGIDSLSYTGTLSRFLLDKSQPNSITAKRLPLFGYADSRPKNTTPTKPRNPYFDDANGKAADGFDISWAVDAEGNHKPLDEIDFVKIYSTAQEDGGWLGEVSPEIFTIAITTPDPEYIAQDYEANAISVPQLQVLKGETLQFEGILFKNGIPQSGTPQWSSSNPGAASIDNTGLLTAVENGDTYISFSAKNDVIPDSVQVWVVELTEVIIELEGNTGGSNDTLEIIVGEIGYIHAEAIDNRPAPKNRFVYESYNWTSSDENIGTIDKGLFRAKNVGLTTVIAQSSHNTDLSDTICVKVNEVPELKMKNDTILITYDNRQGRLNVSDMFVNDKDASMYFKAVSNTESLSMTLVDETGVDYQAMPNIFGYSQVTFEVEMYNQTQTLSLVFSLEDPGYQKNILFVNGGQFMDINHPTQLKTYLPGNNTTEMIDAYIAGATSAQDMIADGNFAYVSADYYVTRYDIAKGIAIDSVYTQDKSSTEGDGTGADGAGLNHKMAIYKNMLLVTRQFSSAAPQDGYNVRVYNKGDLSLIKKIPVSDQATDIVVAGDTAFVMINGGFAGNTSSLAVIDLKDLTLSREISLGESGLGVMQMQVKNNNIYCVRLADFMGRYNSGIVIYNVLNGNISEYEYTADISYDSSPLSIEPMTGDTLFVKKGFGYIAFNTISKTFGADIHFPIPERVNQSTDYGAKGSAYDPETDRYYVAYNYWHGENGAGQIYGSDLDSIGSFEGVGPSPEVVRVSNIYHNNLAPVAGDQLKLFYKDSEVINISLPDNLFYDPEELLADYFLYNPAMLQDGLSYNDETRVLSGQLNVVVTDSTSFDIVMQGIDRFGDFDLSTVILTIYPDNPPLCINPIEDIAVYENSVDSVINISGMFTDPDNDDALIQISVKSNSNSELLSASIVEKELILSFAAGTIGESEIILEAESDGLSVADTFLVNVSSATGINDNFVEQIVLYPNPSAGLFRIQTNSTEICTVQIYNLNGRLVYIDNQYYDSDEIDIINLAAGQYVLKLSLGEAQITKSIIKN